MNVFANNHFAKTFFQLFFFVCITNAIHAQTGLLEGRITDPGGEALPGASIQLKGKSVGTTTDLQGIFSLELDYGTHILKISYVGFMTQEITLSVTEANVEASIILRPDMLQMDEVIVSANFNEKSKLESSVSVSTLNASEIEALAPISALEALKSVPGIYVNEANGEVGVEIQGRGLSTPFFSLQEDGLPSSISELASNEKFERDMFLRHDIMTQRVEAVRGGSASILSANSPGGVINYISRVGGEDFELEFRNRFGVQAGEQEVYNKAELYLGGPVGNTGWNYGVGGHVRYDGGNRLSFFPHSQGGQLKFNLARLVSDDLSVKIFGKYLNDRVGFNRPTLVTNWHDIRPAPGFDFRDNMVLPDVAFSMLDGFGFKDDNTAVNQIRTRDQQNVKDRSIGLALQYGLNDQWRLKSTTRYADKALIINHIAEEGGMTTIDPTGLFARVFANFDLFFTDLAPMTFGKFEFYDLQTNETLAVIDNEPLVRSRPPMIVENNLPGTGEVFWALVDNDELEIEEFIQRLILNGSVSDHNLTLGGYYSLAKNFRVLNAATTFLTVESRQRLLGTRVRMPDYATLARFIPELVPLVDLSNQTAVFNDASGLHSYNSQVNEYNELDERIISFFLSDEWEVSPKVNIDMGLRYEIINHNGRSGITEVFDLQNETGGLDNNRLTVSDNIFQAFGGEYLDFNVDYSSLSYSAGINYKIDNNTAIYGRYSHSEKLLDAIYEQANFIGDQPPTFLPRQVSQAEIGLKYATDKYGLFAVAYRSEENNIFNQLLVVSLSTQEGFYLTPALFNSVEYFGAEIEFNYAPTSWWTLRNILNISGGTNKDFKVWNTGPTDRQEDDILVDLSGEPVAGSTANKFDLSPIDITSNFHFSNKKGTFLVNYRRFARRFANNQQAFTFPSFVIWKMGVAYNLSKNIKASINVNNVFNEVGILRFVATNDVAGFAENVTEDFIIQNPDKWFSVQNSFARAYYFTISYSLN